MSLWLTAVSVGAFFWMIAEAGQRMEAQKAGSLTMASPVLFTGLALIAVAFDPATGALHHQGRGMVFIGAGLMVAGVWQLTSNRRLKYKWPHELKVKIKGLKWRKKHTTRPINQ